MLEAATQSFAGVSLGDLQSMPADTLDALPFGVIGLHPDTTVAVYNATEARLAGLPVATVLGEPYFTNIAQCMNNFLVAQRFEDEEVLDTVLDYVLTLRMRPTPVRLRLLKQPSSPLAYILVQR